MSQARREELPPKVRHLSWMAGSWSGTVRQGTDYEYAGELHVLPGQDGLVGLERVGNADPRPTFRIGRHPTDLECELILGERSVKLPFDPASSGKSRAVFRDQGGSLDISTTGWDLSVKLRVDGIERRSWALRPALLIPGDD